ncbi:MAG: cell division protein SepF [Clostridia bacterium]|nr:cell division protein SepF [Clostridia bacterium]
MGIFDSIKNIMSIPSEEEDFDEVVEVEEPVKKPVFEQAPQKRETQPRILGGGKSKSVNLNLNQMHVVIFKPESFTDVTAIADELNDKKTVVLNLESCEREVSRRIIDFLGGVAYANNGNVRKVAVSTFIIVPSDVGVSGQVSLDEFDDSSIYF